ncbi:AAA domain-containing protein [Clostridium sp. MT-14]|uniref:AAA domain-containing protein n=1 Tax=Clostridium sp. MT-14 TaxID=3348360 RepID=UPI0035F23B7A
MDYRDRVKNIFSYLLSLKKLNQKVIKSVYDYEKLYWEEEFFHVQGCSVNKLAVNEPWIEINAKCGRLYEEFFHIYQENEKNEEGFEIVFGQGLLIWKRENEKIIHPILNTRMKIEFNKRREVFVLTPSNRTVLEISLFEGFEECNMQGIFALADKVNRINLDPRNLRQIEGIFLKLLSHIDAPGEFKKSSFSKKRVDFQQRPNIYNTSVIFVRKNNARLWQVEINNIIKAIDNGCEIPETVKALVNEKTIDCDEKERREWEKVGENVLFPLPANLEQKEIIKKMAQNYGVVVQGPPGTGKSHTIVNLICHLLAHGKRVLVTSQTGRALKVLTEKIPEEIRPLCISVLGNDPNSLNRLNESVRKITDTLSVDAEGICKEVELLKKKLDFCKKRQGELYGKFRDIQELENRGISYNGREYSSMDIAKWVRNNRGKYCWLEDEIHMDDIMPLSEKEFNLLIYLRKILNKNQKRKFDNVKGIIEKLPDDDEICNRISEYKKVRLEYHKHIEILEGWHIPCNNRCNYDKLLELLDECRNKIAVLGEGVWGDIFNSYYSSKLVRQTLKDLLYKSNNCMLILSKVRDQIRDHKIEISDDIDTDKFSESFDILYNSFDRNGKIGKLFTLIHPECNYVLKNCKIDGMPLKNMEQAIIIRLHVRQKQVINELRNMWNNTMRDYGLKVMAASIKPSDIILMEKNLSYLYEIVNWDVKYKRPIEEGLGRISVPRDMDWHKRESYDYLLKCVSAIKGIDIYNNDKAYIEVFKKTINNTGELKKLYEAVNNLNVNQVKATLQELREIKGVKNKCLKVDELIGKLNRICPKTAKNIIDDWDCGKEKFNDWTKAWKWAQWNSLLNHMYSLNLEKIEEAIGIEKNREKEIIKDIVSKNTWYNQILRTTENEKRSLFSWMQAVKRIGKGRGKMVPEYRKIAQREMEKCKKIIPVWIMPLNRVIENVKLSKNMFDVIIFDESSQSDLFSLCALMRAKRAVIVGDDNQISPEVVGVDQRTMYNLINKYLKEIPQRQWFDLQTSLYDTALRVFPARLMLKEHFRCVPEIINFSNNLVYSGEMLTLRYPRINERFYPVINTIKVEEGVRDSSKPVNIKEAECLVDKVAACCRDSKYSNMSMGVISLLGEAQGRLIENMLKDKIGVKEIIRRKLICGDAYSFQGDERDIMFLSMVISKNVKFAPLTKENDIKRFNVAASRARNQMWLFHSVDLKDLNEECVRYSLLNYCLNYNKHDKNSGNVEYIFQTEFQKDVYNLIKSRGYKVTPKVEIGKYNMDFIVEGMRNRVAVICDGDVPSEEYNWKEAVERQLDLERAGWVFYRIMGGEFYYEPEKTMEKLWNKLNNMGIERYSLQTSDTEALKVV